MGSSPAPRLNRIQATSTRGVRARIRRVAGCAKPTGSAGHAGATANLKLTFHLDHSAGADQSPVGELLISARKNQRPLVATSTSENEMNRECLLLIGSCLLAFSGLELTARAFVDPNEGSAGVLMGRRLPPFRIVPANPSEHEPHYAYQTRELPWKGIVLDGK